MTLRKAVHLHNAGANADEVRRMISALVKDSEGVYEWGDLKVSQKDVPNMSVDVSGGRIFITGTEDSVQGTYFCESTSITNITVPAASPSQPRKDLIIARIRDSRYSGGEDTWGIELITGVPDVAPLVPAIPNNSVVLAEINVPAAVSLVTSSNIVNKRNLYYNIDEALPFVSITDYGGVADWVTLNDEALSDAIFAAQEAGHGRVYFPSNSTGAGYMFNNRISMPEKIEFFGDHGGSFGGTGGQNVSIIQLADGVNDHFIFMASGSNLQRITRLMIDGNYAGQTTSGPYDVIHIEDSISGGEEWQGKLVECQLRGGTRYGIYMGDLRRAGLLSDCVVYNNQDTGIRCMASDSELRKCIVGGNAVTGVYLAATIIRMIACDIFNNLDGVVTSNNSTDCALYMNGIDRNLRHGMFMDGDGIVLIGNLFHSNSLTTNTAGSHLRVANTVTNAVVAYNSFGRLDPGIVNLTDFDINFLGTAPQILGAGTNKYDPTSSAWGLSNAPEQLIVAEMPGRMMLVATGSIPSNALTCDGTTYGRTAYDLLFRTIGVQFGAGDGYTTFNVPDLSTFSTPVGMTWVITTGQIT